MIAAKNNITVKKIRNRKEILHDCLICGSPLQFSEFSEECWCSICGKAFSSNIKCIKGHSVCDSCHNGDVLDHMENLLLKSIEINPIRLAEKVFDIPGMKPHGPEHHSMVPAVLETAHQNMLGIRDAGKIREALNRGKDIKGGSCGFHGACGACVGVGIAESIYLGATPVSKEERGKAMQATAAALLAVGQYGGPQCCKRDCITSIRSYMNTSSRFAGIEEYRFICSYSHNNEGCLTFDCP